VGWWGDPDDDDSDDYDSEDGYERDVFGADPGASSWDEGEGTVGYEGVFGNAPWSDEQSEEG
jgi:hypothetical protein